ncbi:Bridge-like lipid transfer protein family member 1 C-terminal domain-containing protein [Caenorhabditis elegans]|uniref:Bridge-like lipid transfer protein family member 1 C-terminal domain-containing protein n=1 Tax=Caenorhabditis elegans TaxID=6239 RepID=A0A0K3AQT9_CAEEL|nr:Bridge-like lipid transfer protein family member 1 C-terminal domain-containing protein [Caenorhabditis elegans]CTQ86404.1 Bridge-like lipid transfer protein family member 1 C-terminal domain-containing protein [Caenorhabditis elegans]|eukprot:NP_001300465.1 LiPid Depleted [Caenorhabditis elegans]
MSDFDIQIKIDDAQLDLKGVSFWVTASVVTLFLAWSTFVVLFFSRVSALFFTFVIDKYLRLSKNGIHFKIGGISISGLHAGKIMFRNVIYDNGDMTIKVNDGHLLFKYWKSVEHRHLNLSTKRASRLHLVLNGLHVNIYNNLTKYTEIARIRRFDWFFENTNMNDARRPQTKPPDTCRSPPSSVWENMWNLLGIVHIEVSAGCILVGNKFLPYALWTRFENLNSKTSVTESANDRALLTFEGETENVAVSLIKNEQFDFTAKDKDPPRTMGNDGCPLLQSASLEFVYKQDLLGYVTDDEPQSITLKLPLWSSEWRFGNNTVLSYGPWAEQQRFLIYSFFYPPDFQNSTATAMPTRGKKRIHVKHDVKIILTKETCMDIWFMRGEQLESIRTRCGPLSSLDMSILWITTEKGFYWNMKAEFLNFEATTSLIFTKLFSCKKFNVDGSFVYPLTWNGEQTWTIDYAFTKANAWFVWDHKRLFTDLINDWIGDDPSDISKFVPFRVHNRMKVVDGFEVIMLLNESNWVDTADMNAENVEVAIVGEKLSFECELPFVDFLPQTQMVKYEMRGEKSVAMRAKFPPDSATAPIRAALSRLARCNSYAPPSKHGTHSLDTDVWFELWRTELVKMDFDHHYRPLIVKSNIPSDIPFSILSDYLPPPANHPWDLEPDYLGVDILIEGSDVKFTGLLVKLLFELKNNYFGWYDSMTSVDDEKIDDPIKLKASFDKTNANGMKPVEYFRTMNVDVTVRVCNVRAEMLLYSPAIDEGAEPEKVPVVFVEEVAVEVKKTKTQALIQVGVSPACAYLDKSSQGSGPGCITLSGFQFRGHAMYSAKEVAWNMGLVEYGWIMEILVGDIAGTLDFPAHAHVLHQIMESLLMFVISPDDATKVPDRMQFCQHGQLIKACSIAGKKTNEILGPCKTEEQMKYRQIRISVDSVNLTFVEEKTILQISADPVRVTICNAHESRFTEHVCIRVPGISIRQAVRIKEKPENIWIEGANAAIEGVSLDIELPTPKSASPTIGKERLEFVRMHDADTKRLHFLWADHSVWGCACFGNTCFFGDVDEIGSTFMETLTKKKFFVPGIERNPEKQPQVMQSVILKNKPILSNQPHMFYKKPKNADVVITIRKESTGDTESFHSARSQQSPGLRILQSMEMSSSYATFVDNVRVELPSAITVPQFGEPGAILEWCQAHQATRIINDVNTSGVNEVRFLSKPKKSQDIEYNTSRDTLGKRRLAINGVAATSLDLFVTPIGIEAFERLVTAASHSVPAINPCILVHMCYRDCVLKKHRQPLTESLFADEDNDSEPISEVDITVDLPRVSIGLFQCGVKKNIVKSNHTDHITANMGLLLIDRAFIQSKLIPAESVSQDFSADTSNLSSTLYQLNGSAITVQLLQLTNRDAPDFGSSGTATTPNNWEHCAISRRMNNLEPRVMMDFNVSDTLIILERRPIILLLPDKSTTAITPIHSPANAPTPTAMNRTPTLTLTPSAGAGGGERAEPMRKKKKMICEHYLKADIGSVTTALVMARPQELTAGDEFPIYEALAPVMVSWLSVVENFLRTVDKFIHTVECWKSVAMAKVLKLALDSTDEKVVVKVGKNRMGRTRVLSAHQASCPSCILLKTLFRWFAYAGNAPGAINHRLDIRPEFEIEETRKTALMALLSHWQSDVGKELKLVSYEDAHRFKVTRPDEAAIVALTKSKRLKRKMLEKKESSKKETRVVMEVKPEQPKAKRGRMSPAPLLKKLRKKAGDDDFDDDSMKFLSDVEMQEFNTLPLYEDYEDDEMLENLDSEPKIDDKVDLYTWMRNAQRESTLRRRKLAGGAEGSVKDDLNLKGYINPMDIQQKAYYYNIYRWAQLQWTSLDGIEKDHWHLDYSVTLREVDVRMMAKSIKNSSDHLRQYITPAQQKVMQVRNAAVNGGMVWKMERDERRKIPLHGQWNISYSGNVEGIRFLIGMATVSLGKELSLVLRVAMEAKNELRMHSTAESTPRNEVKVFKPVVPNQYDLAVEWDEKVLDMTRDYEKHMQRMRTNKEDVVEKVKVMVNGSAMVSSIVLESVLNDLYVSVTISQIVLAHSKNPMPDIPVVVHAVTLSTTPTAAAAEDKKTATLTKKSVSSTFKIDDLTVSLTKMKLTLSEADSSNKKSDILRCTLNSSSFNVHTNLKTLTSAKESNRPKNNLINSNIATTATLRLGALEGTMPMAAYSLHDVVMRHGKELEQQLNRLAAQPASTPLSSSTPFPSAEQSLLAKVADMKTAPEPVVITQAEFKPLTTLPATAAHVQDAKGQIVRRVPVAVVSFSIELTSIEMNIQLLPSLQAKYRINRATSNGITGVQANWSILLDEHFFEFCVTGQGGKTETFRLQLPSVTSDGLYQAEQGVSSQKPSTDKKLIYREGGSLQMTVVLGRVNHIFTTELLNQLMFAEHSFRTELTALINRIRSSSFASTNSSRSAQSTNDRVNSTANLKLLLPVQTTSTPVHIEKPPLLFSIKIQTKEIPRKDEKTDKDAKTPKASGASGNLDQSQHPSHSTHVKSTPWLQLTAATPTQTAVRLTVDSLEGELTNKWVVKEEGSKERIYGNAVIHFNAKLGQLIKPVPTGDSVAATDVTDLQEFATFMTQVRVENKERNMFNSSYSYHISLNRPIFLVKAAAIDKAILLWLNYKNTYDYWRNEREKVVQEKTTTKLSNAGMFSPTQIAEDADMNLSLAINNGMYMCMPLYSHDVTEGMPALVLSLQKSNLSVLVKKELTCKASFNGFKCSFVDDFDEQALTQSFLDATHSDQSNCIFFPEGTYQLCSKAEATKGPAKWVLSVSAEMQGVEIDLDTRIGKLAKLLVNTFSMIRTDDDDDMSFWGDEGELDSDEEKVEGASELKKLKAEEKVPWMENKMHEHSRAVFELAARGVSNKLIEAEKHKLRQYELIRFKAFRRNVVEKLKKGTTASRQHTETPPPQPRPDTTSRRNSRTTSTSQKNSEDLTTPGDIETVNFNLDVKVNITSGTCTLRTQKKEGANQLALPGILKRLNLGTKDIKAMFEPQIITTTTFSIPSVEIKAYHVSDPSNRSTDEFCKDKREKISKGLAKDADKLHRDLHNKSRFGNTYINGGGGPKTSTVPPPPKRGCFYIFVGLASMPSETVVTPHLATYFEQVLEPLPPSAVFQSQNNTREASVPDDGKGDANNEVHNIMAMDTAAFPIDFVFYLDVQSSTIRFDGKQPTSRSQTQADCLLTLPRLTLELTSKRTRDNIDNYVGGIHISGQFKGFMLKIYNPLELEPDSSRALQLSLDLLSFVISRNKNSSTEPDNRVRFVFSSQISKASFEYNFRRLGELIQFPKPWYRAAIARRVFFGDQAAPRQKDDASDITGTTRSRLPTDPKSLQPPAASTASTGSGSFVPHQRKPWTALVLAAIQWNEFEVTAFMSNTMGKTTWKATKGLVWGDAKLNSLNERDVSISFVLGSSELCARDGAISGTIMLNNLKVSADHSLSADVKRVPVNKAKIRLEWITANIEWMSRRVLIAKWCGPSFKVNDYYKGLKEGDHFALSELGMNVQASWKDLQVVITKSTVDDVAAIVNRLISFIDEQLKNSRILLGNLSASTNLKKQAQALIESRKPTTHFWEKVLDYMSEMQMNEQLMGLMEREGAKVGGHIELKAGGISLVMMKGDMNADTWAVFHLRDACILFDPEARMDFLDNSSQQKIGILLKQTFCLQLGSRHGNQTENRANVCRVQTRFNNSRHLQKAEDILEFFIGDVMKIIGSADHSEKKKLKEVEVIQSPISENENTAKSPTSTFSRFRSPGTSKTKESGPATNHNVMELFQFPGLEAKMSSQQLNGVDDGDKYESVFQMPMDVLTTFVCDFFSEVAIETNFNAQVSFLPELLKSYLKESHSGTSSSHSTNSSPAVSSSKESVVSETSKDPRIFTCQEWKVEPRVRFIDRIKWTPPVLDDILKKLQIFDHRNTIPKVIQRAVLDPLDATLAASVIATLQIVDNKKTIQKFKKSRTDSMAPTPKRRDSRRSSEEVSVSIDIPDIITDISDASFRPKHN